LTGGGVIFSSFAIRRGVRGAEVGLRTMLGLKRPRVVRGAWLKPDVSIPASPPSNGVTVDLAQLVTRPIRTVRQGLHRKDNALHFLAFAAAIARSSQAQIHQDAWVLWETAAKERGYFIEFGAADGVSTSNTYVLEKEFGWRGVLAEPNQIYFPKLRKSRSCFVSDKCVFSRTGEKLSFLATRLPGLSRLEAVNPYDEHEGLRADHTETTVETISLNDLLTEAKAPAQIDYMSVDTEGSELEILSHFDFDRWNVSLMTVEHNGTSQRQPLFELLSRNGYRRVWPEITQFEDWYIRDSR
jgi:FkbM family methyltransferase